MTGGRQTPQHDPTAEGTADQSTQGTGGLHNEAGGIRPGRQPEGGRDADDTAYRNDEDLYDTPRRYDESEQDAVMPADDSTLNTKI